MNLAPPTASPANQRPHQQGQALGLKKGKPVQVQVEWLVDTGSDIGVVRKSVGDSFDLSATGASASPTSGGGGFIVKTGLEAEFTAEDSSGVSHTLLASLPVAVKSNNACSDIVGMDQLASVGVTVDWDPAAQSGTLRLKLPPPASTMTAASGSAQLRQPSPPPAIVDHGTWVDISGIRVEKRLWQTVSEAESWR